MIHNCKKTPERLAKAIAMYQTGMTFRAIGAAIGIHDETAHRWVEPAYDKKRSNRTRVAVVKEYSPPRNQYIAAELPTVPYIRLLAVDPNPNRKYEMARPAA